MGLSVEIAVATPRRAAAAGGAEKLRGGCNDGCSGGATAAHCAELFHCGAEALAWPREAKEEWVRQRILTAGPSGFMAGSLTSQSRISFAEEAAVVGFFLALLLAPMLLSTATAAAALAGRWRLLAALVLGAALLAWHPLPNGPRSWLLRTAAARWFTAALFRYFSIRFIWPAGAREAVSSSESFLAFCPPHGVLPIAGLLAIPAINIFARFDAFVGTAASVVFQVPFLRYITAWGTVKVDRASITDTLLAGDAVGIVPDGIAGIFNVNDEDEVVTCLHRRGIARLALRTGAAVVPSYAIGNTDTMHACFDPWGIMRALSRKWRVSLLWPVGRFGLPVPRRANVTMLFGTPIPVEKRPDPSEAEVADLHERILFEVRALFEAHKAALGWGGKRLVFI